MNTATIKRFLMLLSSAKDLERQQLYQLLQKAEYSYCLKDKSQYDIGLILKNFPPPFNLIGDFYQAFYLYRQGYRETAIEKLTTVQEQGIPHYQAKSLLTFGAIHQVEGNIDEAMKVRLVASKTDFLSVVVDAAIGIAALLGGQGKHDEAIIYLENVLPHASKLGGVPLYYDLLNSYAVELAEQGKIDTAQKVIEPVVKSPYILHYPNWLETQSEIKEKTARRSMVTVSKSNIIAFPLKEVEETQEIEEPETEVKEPQFPYQNYIVEKFGLEDKVEDWMCGVVEPDDFGTLLIAIAESSDETERDMIIEKAIDSTFSHTPTGKEAKGQWRENIISRIKDET